MHRAPRIETASLSLFGAFAAACGPVAPATTDGPSDTTTTTPDDSESTPTTAPPEPTSSTADPTTDPTLDPTTAPPECRHDGDCDYGCGYCIEGACEDFPGCCDSGVRVRDGDGWRCSPPPYYDCYVDDDCPENEGCIDNECVQLPIPLPACPSPVLDVTLLQLTSFPSALDLADFDGDGALDLAVALPNEGVLHIALGTGAGEFIPAATHSLGLSPTAMSLASGDFDADGDEDIAVGLVLAGGPGQLRVFTNDGGTLTEALLVDTAAPPVRVIAANVDGALLDDIVTIGDNDVVAVHHGHDATLLSPEVVCPLLAGPGAAVIDIDADGRADLVAAPPPGAADVRLAFANGAGVLADPISLPADLAVSHAHAADLLGGSPASIVATHDFVDQGGGVSVWHADGPGLWSLAQKFSTSSALRGGAIVDFDGDGRPDLVSATGSDSVAVLLGDVTGGFACQQTLPGPGAATEPALLAAGHIDQDDRLDLVVASPATLAVHALRPQ